MFKGRGRIDSVDAVRGGAILLMVFSHGLNWFHVEGSHAVFSIGSLSLGDVATPLFFVIAGVALALSLGARRRAGVERRRMARQYVKRFRQLFILGIPISFLWGVLQAQAVTLGLLVALSLFVFEGRPRPVPARWAFAVGAAAAAGHAVLAGVPLELPGLRLLLQGQFPLLAIMSMVSFGFAAGGLLHSPGAWRRSFAVLGLLFGAAALAFSLLPRTDWARLPGTGWAELSGAGLFVRADMPLPYVFGGLAATLLLTAALDLPSVRQVAPVRLLGRIGRHGLFLYLAHYGLILAQVVLFGWWHSLDTAAAVAASLLLVAMTAFIGLWYRVDAKAIYAKMDAFGRWWSGREPLPAPRSDGPGRAAPGLLEAEAPRLFEAEAPGLFEAERDIRSRLPRTELFDGWHLR